MHKTAQCAQAADYEYINERRLKVLASASQEAAISEIVLDDDVSDGIEHKLNVVSVRCNSKLRVDILRVPTTIQTLKLILDVRTCLLVRTAT